uniref:RING-type E3 ubiquitin transferase n=1 Tax=Otus sunia TaxID=257818 RepID=A0A8C8AF83_9STRI
MEEPGRSMASKDHCLICWNTLSNAALTMTCLHRFCFSCIRWWAEINPECPLCRGTGRDWRSLMA